MSWPMRATCSAAIAILACSRGVGAQQMAKVSGTAIDSATRQPVAGAIVSFRSGDHVVPVRTDEAGAFSARVPTGDVVGEVKRIGYRVKLFRMTLEQDTTLRLLIGPTPRSLAPVNVLGKGEGVFGTIARSADLEAIPGARVLVVGSGITVTTDSAGEFFVPLKHPGAYLVRVVADGYGEEVIPLTVKKNEIAESSQLLDASNRKPISAGLWDDFDQRLRWRPISSALVSGAELRAAGATVLDALRASPSMIRRQLRATRGACVYVNGQPRPGATIDDFRVEDIRAIELYLEKDSIYLGPMKEMWPKGVACGAPAPAAGGRLALGSRGPGGAGTVPTVKWAVIWLR